MIEKEPSVTLANGEEIPQSQLADFHARNAAAMRTYQEKQAAKPQSEFCPFSSALNPVCRGDDCALHVKAGCALKFIFDRPPVVKSTVGRRCPISAQPCAPTCALSETGACVFTSKSQN